MGRFWHPFADMAAVEADGDLVVDRGEGVYIWDERGRRYLDATAALWYCNVGYGRREIADAAAGQLRRLAAYSAFGDLANRPALELADRVAEIAPVRDSRVFLTHDRALGTGALQVSPALVVDDPALQELRTGLRVALDTLI